MLDTAHPYNGLQTELQPDCRVGGIKGVRFDPSEICTYEPDVIGVFIPIVAIVMGIGIGMLSVWTEHKRKAQLLDQYHRERIVALEKGLPLPELDRRLVALDESEPPPRRAPSATGSCCF